MNEISLQERARVKAKIEALVETLAEQKRTSRKPDLIGPSLPSWWSWRSDLVKVPGSLPISRALAKAMGFEVGYVED